MIDDTNYIANATRILREEMEAVFNVLGREWSCSDEQLALYLLLALSKGQLTGLRDVHDAWALRKAIDRPDHPSIVPFDQLTFAEQEKGRPFMDAIRLASIRLQG